MPQVATASSIELKCFDSSVKVCKSCSAIGTRVYTTYRSNERYEATKVDLPVAHQSSPLRRAALGTFHVYARTVVLFVAVRLNNMDYVDKKTYRVVTMLTAETRVLGVSIAVWNDAFLGRFQQYGWTQGPDLQDADDVHLAAERNKDCG